MVLKKRKQIVYVVTVTYELFSTMVMTDVLIVTESRHKAFEVIEKNDHMKIIREETEEGFEMVEGRRNKDFGVTDSGAAVYEEVIYVHPVDDNEDDNIGCTVIYQIIKMEVA